MRQILAIIFTTIFFLNSPAFAQKKKIVTVNQFARHVALDAAYEGLVSGFKKRGIQDELQIIQGNAQGNISSAVQIAKYQASLSPDFMIAIATPAAQVTVKSRYENAVFGFLAVTDPEGANLTNKENVIGISDNPPIKQLVELLPSTFKDLKKIGVLYNAGEINSVHMIKTLEELVKLKGIEIVKSVINNSSDIKNGMSALIGEVDVVYIPQDNTVVAAIDSVAKIAKQHKVALIANDPSLVEKGVLLALGTNYFRNGEQLAGMIADIIAGKEVSPKIQQTNTLDLKINDDVANEIGITIDESVRKRAGGIQQ